MSDIVSLPLPGSVELRLSRATAEELVRRWSAQLEIDLGTGAASPAPQELVLADDHPLWEHHSGGPGHRELPEWDGLTDLAVAEAFYRRVGGKAKVFLNLLIDRPGRPLTVEEICAESDGAFASSHSIAGAIYGLQKSQQESGRRYPFYWWEGRSAQYAMKATVARLFHQARRNVSGAAR